MGTHPIFESDFDCLTEMFHRYRLPFLATCGTFYLAIRKLEINLNKKFRALKAKSEEKNQINEKEIKILGFVGRPESVAIINYLKWKNIDFSFENVNPIKLDKLPYSDISPESLPIVTVDDVT